MEIGFKDAYRYVSTCKCSFADRVSFRITVTIVEICQALNYDFSVVELIAIYYIIIGVLSFCFTNNCFFNFSI